MSDNIPLEIQAEILKRLPIKSLFQYRTVSKQWKSLIDSSKFIADFNFCHTDPNDLFVSYNNNNEQKYVSFIDDNTFPQHKCPLTLPISSNINQLRSPIIIGSSRGLFCFYSYDVNANNVPRTKTVVIWNPSVRKSVFILVPNVLPPPYKTVVVFGVCPYTNNIKLVKFVYKEKVTFLYPYREFVPKDIPLRVEICGSKCRVWETMSTNLPRESIALTTEHVAIDKFIYWFGYDRKDVGGNIVHCNNLILLFDITNEEFTEEINLPDSLQGVWDINMRISKLRDSLIVLETDIRAEEQVYDVWIMENGVSKSFRKLYTIKAPHASIVTVLGFRKSGEAIIEMMPHYDERNGLFVYDSDTEQFNSIGISGNDFSYFASSYVESLLLLDH